MLATVGLGGLVSGFLESVNLGWGNPRVFGSLMVGFGCLIAFVFAEAHRRAPMLPLALFESGAILYYLAENLDPQALAMMRAIKKTIDPQNIMNPGKVLTPIP